MMDLDKWPIYVTDEGVVRCDQSGPNCDGVPLGDWLPGRRHTLGDLVDAAAKHALEVHGVQAE